MSGEGVKIYRVDWIDKVEVQKAVGRNREPLRLSRMLGLCGLTSGVPLYNAGNESFCTARLLLHHLAHHTRTSLNGHDGEGKDGDRSSVASDSVGGYERAGRRLSALSSSSTAASIRSTGSSSTGTQCGPI
ncbi:hypothetical protein IQ07DRAFT_603570 [Pyrenochaeta sp. DS3sAY3a]|nr:hypothetical protein IQ07DRAFT_603570 [Pyrenochaeta sp. DS3sAY3a]